MTSKEPPAPWRDVVFLGARELSWWLVLSCGHLTMRSKQRMPKTPTQLAQAIFRPRSISAPHRVRCVFCQAGLPGQPIDQLVELVQQRAPI